MRTGWIVALLLAGCDEAPEVGACKGQTVTASTPAAGAAGVFFRDVVSVELGSPDPDATISVAGPAGAVAGVSAVDGVTVTFTPNDGFAPETTYTATWSSCGDEGELSFTTGAYGAPLADPPSEIGATYFIDLTSGTIASPAGLGDTLDVLLGGYPILASVVGFGSGGSVDLRIALGVFEPGNLLQDTCSVTLEMVDVAFENPYFSEESDAFSLTWDGVPFTLTAFHASGAFSADGETLGGVRVAGQLDTRPLIPVFNDDPTVGPDQMCVFVEPFRVDCVECADGSGPYCLDLELVGLVGERRETAVEPRTYEQIGADPACAEEG